MLRTHSQHNGRKLVEVAQAIVDSHLLLLPSVPEPATLPSVEAGLKAGQKRKTGYLREVRHGSRAGARRSLKAVVQSPRRALLTGAAKRLRGHTNWCRELPPSAKRVGAI
jgi:hypothetical protein